MVMVSEVLLAFKWLDSLGGPPGVPLSGRDFGFSNFLLSSLLIFEDT